MKNPAQGAGYRIPAKPYGSLTFALQGNAASGGEYTRHDSKHVALDLLQALMTVQVIYLAISQLPVQLFKLG